MKLFYSFLFLLVISRIVAQNGFIRGTVYDASTGEFLPGVTILVTGTTTGTITDLDGNFSLPLATGTYNLTLSFISYEPLKLNNIQVEAGGVTLLNELSLKEASIALSEITVSAQAVRNTENALFTIKQKSANVLDGISASGFRKIGDSDAASSMKRVPGVSVEGGKYVFIRGLGDRYTKTILNGVDIPGLDPDRNTLQMDLFPVSIIDNIIVHKSFSADLPADFTGGVIDIATKDFPEKKTGSISLSGGYNPKMHFNSNYLDYEGGATDFLGFDDGTRKIPATTNIPQFAEAIGDPDGLDGIRYREILNGFSPTLSASRKQSFMDADLGISFGNQKTGEKLTWGYNVAFSYKNSTELFRDAIFSRYGLVSDNRVYELEQRELQEGDFGVNTVLWSGMAGMALKTRKSKYGLTLLRIQNGESTAGIFDYISSDQGSEFVSFQHILGYSQRSLTNFLLSGKQTFNNAGWELEWKLSPTFSSIHDPDIRFTRYELLDNGGFGIGTETGFPERIWRELEEMNLAGVMDVTKSYQLFGQKSKLLFGGAYTYKERDFIIRNFALNIRNVPLTGNPDELFYEENLWPLEGDLSSGTTFEAPFIKNDVPNNPNQYNSTVNNISGYISTELSLTRMFRAVLGLRAESYTQRYTGQNQGPTIVYDNDVVLDQLDIFPSVNLIYSLTAKQNVRASWSKTIARPSFKELSYAEIYDPVSSRTFVGGLYIDGQNLNDADPDNDVVYWNGKLTPTYIQNFDVRWELNPSGNQMISVSGFYKKFRDPIEIVQYASQAGSFQPRNVGDSEVIGAETEVRLSFETLTSRLRNLGLLFNLTLTESRIRLSQTEYDSRVLNARADQTIGKYREMAGQAPYIINAGISYNGGSMGFWKEFEAGFYYNVQGQTLQYVGITDRPDIYMKPFHSLNFNSNKKLGKDNRFQIGIKVENILNEKKESVFKSFEAAEQFFERMDPGMQFKMKISYSIF